MGEILLLSFFGKIAIVAGGVILLTFLQQIHFTFLQKLAYRVGRFFHRFVMFLLRVWIIIHELFHLIFAFFAGHRIEKIQLFKEDGGQVDVKVDDYLGSMPYQNQNFITYFILLFFNRLGIFLTGVAPLLWGIFFHCLLFSYWFSITTHLAGFNLLTILTKFWWWSIVIFLYVLAVMPSFLLSWQDIRSIIFYPGKNFLSAFFWTLLSVFFVLLFLSVLTYFFFPIFVSFLFFYCLSFWILCLLYLISLIFASDKL